MKRLDIVLHDAEEKWGDYLPYEDVLSMLQALKKDIVDGFGSIAVEEIDKQLGEWGEEA